MARNDKHTRSAVGHLGKHFERGKGADGELVKYGNQSIKPELSHLNYNLAPERNMSHPEYVKQRTNEVYCLNRKDVNVMSTWVVTLPKDFPKEQEREFFQKTYDFLKERYGGEKNVISSYVHLDENQPHMHFAFVPVVRDKKKGHLKVSAKECINKQDLQTFHTDLSKTLERHFGRDVGILNEATKEGNKSIEELKRKSAAERLNEVENKAKEIITDAHDKASKIVFKAQEEARGIEDRVIPLKAEYEAMKAFIDQSVKDSNVSMMYPDYVEVIKKGIIKKQEYVLVPKEKWEAKHVSANQIEAIKQEREALEKQIKAFKSSAPVQQVKALEREVKEVRQENRQFKEAINRLNKTVDRVNNVFKERPDIQKEFFKAEKEIKKAIQKSRGWEPEL